MYQKMQAFTPKFTRLIYCCTKGFITNPCRLGNLKKANCGHLKRYEGLKNDCLAQGASVLGVVNSYLLNQVHKPVSYKPVRELIIIVGLRRLGRRHCLPPRWKARTGGR